MTTPAPPRAVTLTDEQEEASYFQRVHKSLEIYDQGVLRRVALMERAFLSIPAAQQRLVPGYLERITALRRAVTVNQSFLGRVLDMPHAMLDVAIPCAKCEVERTGDLQGTAEAGEPHGRPGWQGAPLRHIWQCSSYTGDLVDELAFDVDKTLTTVKMFARDWSAGGAPERRACYGPLIDAVCARFPDVPAAGGDGGGGGGGGSARPRGEVRVLVPGCGLGRLAWEFAHRGFACQGNEVSYHMLLSASFILNLNDGPEAHVLHPWVSQGGCNVYSGEQQLEAVRVPDVDTCDLPAHSDFSMAAGDFLDIYRAAPAHWAAVATCFFLDTARNVIAYIEALWEMLEPGGVWANLGPLLYHYSEQPGELSVELTFEEVCAAVRSVGFVLEEQKFPLECTYIGNPLSMMNTVYRCAFFVARKPAAAASNASLED